MTSDNLRTHVQVIAWLNIVLGALSLIGGLTAFLMFGGFGLLAASQTTSTDPSAGAFGALFGGFGLLLAGVALISGLPGLLVGAGMLRYAGWARIGCIILSILHLINASTMGLSTVLGVYSLVILFQPECEKVFRS
jgi:hypothetical protein